MVPFGDFMSCAEVNRESRQALARGAAVCLLMAAVISLGPPSATRAEPRAIRALSLAAADLDAGAAPRRLLAARDSGIDTVFVPVSIHAEPADAAIEAFIREAHGRGLRVHAAIPILFAAPAGPLPLAREHAIYQHPEWLMVPRELAIELQEIDGRSPDYLGRLARWTRGHPDRIDGLYLSPLQPEAAAFVADAVGRLVSRHAFDGVHFEAVRFPDLAFDYSARARDVFRGDVRRSLSPAERTRIDDVERIDPFAFPDELPDEWRRFRRTRLTTLVARLRTAVKAARPNAIVSASAVAGARHALDDHLQDWRTWADNGFVDALAGPAAATTTLLFSYESLLDPGTPGTALSPSSP